MAGIKVLECVPFNKHYREGVFAAGLSVKQHRMKLEITYHIHFFLHFLFSPPPQSHYRASRSMWHLRESSCTNSSPPPPHPPPPGQAWAQSHRRDAISWLFSPYLQRNSCWLNIRVNWKTKKKKVRPLLFLYHRNSFFHNCVWTRSSVSAERIKIVLSQRSQPNSHIYIYKFVFPPVRG